MKMKNLFVLVLVFVASTAFAQAAINPPTSAELTAFLATIGGLKGASAMAIAAFAVQGILLFFRSSFGNLAGIYQLLIVNAMTLVAGILALMMSGQSFLQALLNSQTLAMIQVFAHQVLTQFGKKNEDQK